MVVRAKTDTLVHLYRANILPVRTTLVTLPLSSSTNVPIERQVRATVRYYHNHDRDVNLALQRSVEDYTSDLHQVSFGSAWTVGGVAPSGTAINNGRGHLVQTGTNARMFRTNYSTAKLKVNEELEKHRDRLATALEFDQSARTLDFNINAKSITRQQMKKLSALTPRKTFWDGSQWKNEHPTPSKTMKHRQQNQKLIRYRTESPKAPENRDIPENPFK